MRNHKKWIPVLIIICMGVILEVIFGKRISAKADESVYHAFTVTEKGVMYLPEDGMIMTDCWLNLPDGRLYHLDSDGYIQLGMTRVDGKTYYLWYTGVMTTGWLTQGEDVYFFLEDGTMAVDTEIDGYRFGSDGRLITETTTQENADTQEEAQDKIQQEPQPEIQSETVAELQSPLAVTTASIIDAVTTEEMNDLEKLSACYQHIVNGYSYKRTYDTLAGDWPGNFALELFTTGQGNCYRYAAGFAALAKGLGFETKVITGSVKARRGGTTPHGWVEVRIGDTWYLFDPELQFANKRDLYMKTYETYPVKPLNKEAEWEIHF